MDNTNIFIETAINRVKTTLFWKDKTMFINQFGIMKIKKNLALNITYVTELAI